MKTTFMKHISFLSRSGIFSTQLAIASFFLGSVLFMLNRISPDKIELMIAGLVYVVLASVTNGIVFLILFYYFITNKKYREYFAVKMLIMLANIPVAVLYVLIVFNFNLF
jgi:uncharacterized membrane-anchored protein